MATTWRPTWSSSIASCTTFPDASIAGDLIVGFPTETEEDFQATCDLVRRIPFKNNFVFTYSPRPGTAAMSRFEDDIPGPVKRRRINELLAIQSEVSGTVHKALEGTLQQVFVERVSPQQQRAPGGSNLGGNSLQCSFQAALQVI